MSEETTETPAPAAGGPAAGNPEVRPAGSRAKKSRAAGGGKRGSGRRKAVRVIPAVRRAVTVSFAVASAGPDVLEALTAITGTGNAEPEAVAMAVAADAAGDPGLLVDVLSLPAAGPADGMRAAISVASAGRDVQRELWAVLTRLGFASGRPSPNPEELALAIVEAGQGIPEHAFTVLRAALDILAAGRES